MCSLAHRLSTFLHKLISYQLKLCWLQSTFFIFFPFFKNIFQFLNVNNGWLKEYLDITNFSKIHENFSLFSYQKHILCEVTLYIIIHLRRRIQRIKEHVQNWKLTSIYIGIFFTKSHKYQWNFELYFMDKMLTIQSP